MSARKPHHKSRLGCSGCKRRRIKCDEGRPSCRNCNKRGLQCSFPSFDSVDLSAPAFSAALEKKSFSRVLVFPPSPEEHQPGPSRSLSPPSLADALAQNGALQYIPESLQGRFKHALHHFMTVTIATISTDIAAQQAWTSAIPKFGAKDPYILDGIFSAASLHLSRCVESEDEKRIHLSIATDRLNKGLTWYRKGIENVTESNAEALFSFSTMTTAFILVTAGDECSALSRRLSNKDLTSSQQQAIVDDMIACLLSIFRCLRGRTLVILQPCWPYITRGILGPAISRDWWPPRVPISPEAIEVDGKLRALEDMWMRPGRKYEPYFDILTTSLAFLRESFALVSRLTLTTTTTEDGKEKATFIDFASVLVWPVGTSTDFLALLEQRIPEAWVILAHYAMLPSKVQGVWWIEHIPSHLLCTAAIVLGRDNWGLIEWPARAVGVDLESLSHVSRSSGCGTTSDADDMNG